MLLQHQLVSKIKSVSWKSRENFLTNTSNSKFLNAYSLYETLQEPKNWLEIAEKCSVNPKHEHYGKEPQDIVDLWQTKKEYKAKEGNTLDDYIKLKIEQTNMPELLTFKQRETDLENLSLVQKCNQFDKLYDTLLQKLSYIGSELWLTSDIGLNLRCDALFNIPDPAENCHHLVVMEWKSLDNIKMSNFFNKLQGPLKGFDDCDAVKFTIQTHLYRYVLERYDIFGKVMTNIYNFNTLAYQRIDQQFPYDKTRIEEIISYAKEKLIIKP